MSLMSSPDAGDSEVGQALPIGVPTAGRGRVGVPDWAVPWLPRAPPAGPAPTCQAIQKKTAVMRLSSKALPQ